MNNLNSLDRFLRTLLGLASLELAYFWLSGGWQVAIYLVGAILMVSAAIRFCPLYQLLGLRTNRSAARSLSKPTVVIAWLLLIGAAAGGAYGSAVLTRKLFLTDFGVMNGYYKQTLFLTAKNEREKAIEKYDGLLSAYRHFQDKYSAYRPYVLKGDHQLSPDLARVADVLSGVDGLIRTGDLHQAHLGLEKVRPVFQEIFKRNGLSMLAVALVDFHDAMERMVDAAGAKEPNKLVALYPQASEKLKVIEAEANDEEIQSIRRNLDELFHLAKDARNDLLEAKGEELKSSFIMVYLKRG